MPAPSRRRIFIALVVVCGIGAVVAVALGIASQDKRVPTSAAAQRLLADARRDGRTMVVFRALKPKGQLAVAPVTTDGDSVTVGRRSFEPMSCERVYYAGGRGLCVARRRGAIPGFDAEVFGPDMKVAHRLRLDGVPSRTRVSPDGRYGAVTMFVAGHSYAAAGSFSTATTLIDMASGRALANLEKFTVTRDGQQVTAIDVNYWGVTFSASDSDRFYATLATGGQTYLIEGSVSSRTAHVIHENVECPSLSPDGTRIAFKKRTGSSAAPWRLTVLDLATMRETSLAETRSVDDQAEWLDDHHVLYGLDGQVWSVPADGSGRPRAFLASADSPASVRP
jgi:WD40-like Beta Propeller Repeat